MTTETQPSRRWKPKDGEIYWCIGRCGDIAWDSWGDTEGDNMRFNVFNCFPTREAAQREADRRLIDAELRAFCNEKNAGEVVDWESEWQEKYGLHSLKGNISLTIGVNTNGFLSGCAFVGPEAWKHVEEALEKFGSRLQLLTRP